MLCLKQPYAELGRQHERLVTTHQQSTQPPDEGEVEWSGWAAGGDDRVREGEDHDGDQGC